MRVIDTIWRFETARFVVAMVAEEELDLDLSWDDDGSARAGLEDGTLVAFCAHCVVKLDGRTVGEDYLGGCIYKDYAGFRDHLNTIRLGKRGLVYGASFGSYFSDMVREAIKEARRTLAHLPRIHRPLDDYRTPDDAAMGVTARMVRDRMEEDT